MHFHLICKRNSKYLLVVNRVKGFPTATARTASVLSLMDPSVSSRRSFSRQTRPPEQFVDFSTDSPQQPQAKKKKKNSPNEKAASAFISTATLIDIPKVEQLLSVLTTAG